MACKVNVSDEEMFQNGSTANVYSSGISAETYSTISDVCYRGIFPTLIGCGFVMNVFSLMILLPTKPRTSTSIYLIFLTVADIWILLNGVANVTIKILKIKRNTYSLVFASFINPVPGRIGNILTSIIAIERLVAVVKPLKVRQLSSKRLALALGVFVNLYVVIVTLPNAFLYRIVNVYNNKTGTTKATMALTDFGKQKTLVDTFYIIVETLVRFIPVFIVTVATMSTLFYLLYSTKKRLVMIQRSQIPHQKKELQITRTLLIVTFVFIVCQLPGIILRLVIFIEPNNALYSYKNNVYGLLTLLTYFLFLLNSCTNFVIYITSCAFYRKVFRSIICRGE